MAYRLPSMALDTRFPAGMTHSFGLAVNPSFRDSRWAALPRALRVNANPLPADLCRNPGSMEGLQSAIHGTGYPLPSGYDGLNQF